MGEAYSRPRLPDVETRVTLGLLKFERSLIMARTQAGIQRARRDVRQANEAQREAAALLLSVTLLVKRRLRWPASSTLGLPSGGRSTRRLWMRVPRHGQPTTNASFFSRGSMGVTLNLLLVSPKHVYQCSDFRLTYKKGFQTDHEAQKIVTVSSQSWSALVQFTGAAKTATGFDTCKWLANLVNANMPFKSNVSVSWLIKELLGVEKHLKNIENNTFSVVVPGQQACSQTFYLPRF
jgi:hypothetical protein